MKLFTRTQQMGAAALIMAASVFVSRFMGLVRDKVISYLFGATVEADVYFAAFVVPDFINYLLAGGYFSITLIPLLSERFERDPEDGWRFFAAAFWWIAIAICLLTGVAWWFAPELARVAAPGFDAPSTARLVRFLRIILPAQAFFLPGACVTALLYMRRQFAVPAMGPLVYNGCIIGGGVLSWALAPARGMEGFCWGVLAGAALGSFGLPLLAAARGGGVRLRPVLRHPGVRRFALLALPLMIGQSVVVLDEQFVRIFGSMTGEGAVSLLNYARRIMLVPVGVVAQAAGVASYPFLAALAARGEAQSFDATLSTALRNALAVIIPLSAWMLLAAEPTMRLIFQGGGFAAAETLASAPLLRVMLCGVAFWAVQQVVGRAFYAHQDTVTPAVVGTLATLAALPLYVLAGHAGARGTLGVAAAGTVAVAVYTVALALVWRRRHGGGGLSGIVGWGAKSAALCAAAALPAWPALAYAPLLAPATPAGQVWGAFLALAASGPVFAVAYLLLARRLAPDLAEPVLSRLRPLLARVTGRPRGRQDG
ncbi:murein biosynthesis integral membrane protein MurJ [Nitratidesulfovibrio sp. D1]|uniref:murein biosynthesis integral membrane protein MurJ n=1 Tax=Nitratidesulfovibrio sp. D1 TaxID=3440151 RepID=UPI003EC0DA83